MKSKDIKFSFGQGTDANASHIIARGAEALRKANIDDASFLTECAGADYSQLQNVILRWFTVSDEN